MELRNQLGQRLLELDGEWLVNLMGQTIGRTEGNRLLNLQGQVLAEVHDGRVCRNGVPMLIVQDSRIVNQRGETLATVGSGPFDAQCLLGAAYLAFCGI